MANKKVEKPVVKVRKQRAPSYSKELKAILKALEGINVTLDNIWRERRP